MSTPTFSDLSSAPTQEEIMQQEVMPELQARGVKITDWLPKGCYRAMAYVVAKMRASAMQIQQAVFLGYFGDYCFGRVPAPFGIDVTSWAPIKAKQDYGIDQIEATFTRRNFMLTNASNSSYGPLQAGDVMVQFPSGNRYVLDEDAEQTGGLPITIPASGSVNAIFRSEYVSNSSIGHVYNSSVDLSGSSISLVTTSFPGVTVTNLAKNYSDVERVGSGVGTITPSNTPNGNHYVSIRIDSSGKASDSSAGWSTQVDGGSWTSHTGTTATNLGGYNIDVTLADNSGNPSFIFGTMYYFQCPGSDIIEVGRDIETPQDLGARVAGIYPSLAFAKDPNGNWIPVAPTMTGFEALARSSNDAVKICYVKTGSVNGQVIVYVAGQGALLTTAELANVAAFFAHYNMIAQTVVVAQPTLRTITLGALTIYVLSGQLAAAQDQFKTSLGTYFGGTDPVEQLNPNGLIKHGYLVKLIEQLPGLVKFTDSAMTINGAAVDLQLPITPGAVEMASWVQTAIQAATWVTV